MEKRRPSVKQAFPVGDAGVRPLPDYFDVQRLIEEDSVILYNPFVTGLTIKKELTSSLTYTKLASAFIIDSMELDDPESRSIKAQNQHNTLHHISNVFWPVAVSTFQRQAVVPKRDDGWKKNITPDMGLVVSPPKRKIKTPKLTQKPSPPKR